MQIMKKIIQRLMIIVCLGVLCHLVYLNYNTDFNLWEYAKKIGGLYFSIILVLSIFPSCIHAFRLKIWTLFLGYNIKYLKLLHIVSANDIASAAAPNFIGGSPIKFGMLISQGVSKEDSTFLILLSTLEDIVFYTIGTVFTLVYLNKNLTNITITNTHIQVLILLFLSVITLFYFKERFTFLLQIFFKEKHNKIKEFIKNKSLKVKDFLLRIKTLFIYLFKNGKSRLCISAGLLLFQWLTKFSILILVFNIHKYNVDWLEVIIKQWLIFIGAFLLPLPGGTGGIEAGFVLMFKNYISTDHLPILLSTWRFYTFYLPILISAVFYMLISKKNIQNTR